MHNLGFRRYATVTKIDRYVSVKQFSITNDLGLRLYGIKESKQLFYSEESNPVRAFERFAHKTASMVVDRKEITRDGKRLKEIVTLEGEREQKYMYSYKVEGDSKIFETTTDNIHHAFLLWKLQHLSSRFL